VDRLYILACGTPTPTRHRFGTASVVQLGDDYVMVDCGPAATHKLVKAGLWPTRIEHLLLTHHHFDHNADLPCFLLCRWDQSIGREAVLKVFGPPPTATVIERLIGPAGAFVDDWKARVNEPVSQIVHRNRGGSLPRPEPRVQAADVGPGEVIDTGRWRVSCEKMRHTPRTLTTLGYRIDSPGGAIVFAADTGPCEELTRLAAGCDVLVVNCWDLQERMDANGEAPGQTGTMDAAKAAADTGARRLVLTHTGPKLCRPKDRAKALDDIAKVFSGQTIFAKELMKIDLW